MISAIHKDYKKLAPRELEELSELLPRDPVLRLAWAADRGSSTNGYILATATRLLHWTPHRTGMFLRQRSVTVNMPFSAISEVSVDLYSSRYCDPQEVAYGLNCGLAGEFAKDVTLAKCTPRGAGRYSR
jgi:hypothetical protein